MAAAGVVGLAVLLAGANCVAAAAARNQYTNHHRQLLEDGLTAVCSRWAGSQGFLQATAARNWGEATPAGYRFAIGPSSAGSPEGRCGTWQEAYTQLHRDILAGKAPQRYVTVSTGSGLADMMSGAVAIFYYALLTNRAFLWDYPFMADAYAQPHVNWTARWKQGGPPGQQVCKLTVISGTTMGPEADATWHTSNISRLCEDSGYVKAHAGRGMTYNLFGNPYHARQLYAMGLQPENGFGCVINYLLQLHPQVEQQFAHAIERLSDPDVLKIGMQIRTGDHAMFAQSELSVTDYDAFFACADEVEKTRGMAYPGGVLWFLITDSVSLRRQVIHTYSSKVYNHSVPLHVGHVTKSQSWHNESSGMQVFMHAAAENWLFGMLDVHIISGLSGYGRTAAFRSLRWQSVYTIQTESKQDLMPGEPKSWIGKKRRACGLEDYDRLDDVGRDRSRVLMHVEHV